MAQIIPFKRQVAQLAKQAKRLEQRIYATYPFQRFDPVMTRLRLRARSIAQTEKVPVAEVVRQACELSGVSPGCVQRWWAEEADRRTRHPQHATVRACGRALERLERD